MGIKLKDIDTRTLIDRISLHAEELRNNAGFSGEWGDGGAGDLEEKLNVFECALRGELPAEWTAYAREIEREKDPEYKEFLRLREKFGE